MIRCRKCGFEFDGKFCPKCGTKAFLEDGVNDAAAFRPEEKVKWYRDLRLETGSHPLNEISVFQKIDSEIGKIFEEKRSEKSAWGMDEQFQYVHEYKIATDSFAREELRVTLGLKKVNNTDTGRFLVEISAGLSKLSSGLFYFEAVNNMFSAIQQDYEKLLKYCNEESGYGYDDKLFEPSSSSDKTIRNYGALMGKDKIEGWTEIDRNGSLGTEPVSKIMFELFSEAEVNIIIAGLIQAINDSNEKAKHTYKENFPEQAAAGKRPGIDGLFAAVSR